MMKTVSLVLASVPAAAACPQGVMGFCKNDQLNCWDGHGAEEIDTVSRESHLDGCLAKCSETPGCTSVTVSYFPSGFGLYCWRRKNVQLAQCETDPLYDTWVQIPTPPVPASGFAATNPEFIKAFIEGILSDNGTDVKKCELNAVGFAENLLNLVQTSVGAEKAVAAAVEETKGKCTVVEAEAKKLSFSALQDVLHPKRLAQNFAATQKDVLEDFGQALEMMAKNDFRNAGDKVGMSARRIVEGAQETNSLPSAYTKLGEMNCYADNGATDLEKEVGQPCGKMTVDQCKKKCDELAGCQGITVSHWLPEDSDGMVLCYRRGSIKVGQCDHQAEGYDTFVNPAVEMTTTSSAVATVAFFAVTHFGAATMPQSDMPSATPANWGDFLEGVLEGLMSDGSDLGDCEATVPAVREAVNAAKEQVGKASAAAIAAGKIAKQSCGVVATEGEKLALATFRDIKQPDQVVQHFKDTQFDFLMEMGKAFEALAGKNYTTAGTQMGMAMRRALEGKQANTVIV